MKRPSKKPRKVFTQDGSERLTAEPLSPDALRALADWMESMGYVEIRIESGYDGAWEILTRIETEDEAADRYKNELAMWKAEQTKKKARLESKKKSLLAEAKKLGLKVSE